MVEVIKNVFDGITKDGLADALILATVAFIEKDPAYNYVGQHGYCSKNCINKLLVHRFCKLILLRTIDNRLSKKLTMASPFRYLDPRIGAI